ncbi:hypothetical protein M231_01751 [Tremella mesenterica]|uniref:Uncharacterized protein n=1 Tax=Tremella mesenterica TaxID=5217 RepID=A0A4Q1BSA1_TREME|nr:hypothetical protein M231_01751 [Tremella mesenterica]
MSCTTQSEQTYTQYNNTSRASSTGTHDELTTQVEASEEDTTSQSRYLNQETDTQFEGQSLRRPQPSGPIRWDPPHPPDAYKSTMTVTEISS